jgi:DNA-sulfur modification-associated
LARLLMERSGILGAENVEIISNNLSRNSAKMVTFGTLNDGLKMAFPGLGEDEVEATLDYLVKFLEQLHIARPDELALLSVANRKKVRDTTLADQGILWQAYLRLSAWLRENSPGGWKEAVQKLAVSPFRYRRADNTLWTGDLFSRNNPLWLERGILAPGKAGLRVVHGRSARQAVYEILKEVVSDKDFAAPKDQVPALVAERDHEAESALVS